MAANDRRIFDETLRNIEATGAHPRLLLHSCCGPCSTTVLELLTRVFDVTICYYNPNIYPAAEYEKRAAEQRRLIAELTTPRPVAHLDVPYDPERFDASVKGLEAEPEGGQRCTECFRLRLDETARRATELGFEYFTTTLSVSPHKNAALLNKLGVEAADKYGVNYLTADFKKKDGYKRSIELSRQFDLYRQDYCGCRFSLLQRGDLSSG